MNVSSWIESDIAQRIQTTLSDRAYRVTRRSCMAGTIWLLALTVMLPSSGVAQDRDATTDVTAREVSHADANSESRDDGVDWESIKNTAPEDWTDEQKAQIETAGYDLQAITERVRHYQREQASRPEHEADDDRLATLQRRVIGAAMAAPPEEWSQELKDAIVRAGWDLDRFTDGVRQRQAVLAEGADQGAGDDDDGDLRDHRDPATTLEQIGQEIRAAVTAGTITAEQGRERYEAARQRLEERQRLMAAFEKVNQEIQAALDDGAITAEQARERFLAARDRLAAALGQNTDRADHDGDRDRDDAIGDSDRRDGLTEFQKGVAARAMATPPDQWSDGLKAAIRRAGWDADALAARVRRARQDGGGAVDLTVLGLTNTAIEESSWGEIKSEIQEK